MDKNGNNSKEIGSRIDKIRQHFCGGVNIDFADKIGKDPTYTSQLCNGSKPIGKKILELILMTFPEVSRVWLYFGEGEMLVNSLPAPEPTVQQVALPVNSSADENKMLRNNNAALLKHIALLEDEISRLRNQLVTEREKTQSASAPIDTVVTLV